MPLKISEPQLDSVKIRPLLFPSGPCSCCGISIAEHEISIINKITPDTVEIISHLLCDPCAKLIMKEEK
jgi:hypothetical protein